MLINDRMRVFAVTLLFISTGYTSISLPKDKCNKKLLCPAYFPKKINQLWRETAVMRGFRSKIC